MTYRTPSDRERLRKQEARLRNARLDLCRTLQALTDHRETVQRLTERTIPALEAEVPRLEALIQSLKLHVNRQSPIVDLKERRERLLTELRRLDREMRQ